MKNLHLFLLLSFLFLSIISITCSTPKNNRSIFEIISQQLTELKKNTSTNILTAVPNFLEKKTNAKALQPPEEILFQGWLKYLKIKDADTIPPTKFFQNPKFSRRRANQGEDCGSIPSENHFYFELSCSHLSVYASNAVTHKKLMDSLWIEEIVSKKSEKCRNGGVEDLGKFAEGYCFIVKYIRYSQSRLWELCADSPVEKDLWIKWLKKVVKKNRKNIPPLRPLAGLSISPPPAIPQGDIITLAVAAPQPKIAVVLQDKPKSLGSGLIIPKTGFSSLKNKNVMNRNDIVQLPAPVITSTQPVHLIVENPGYSVGDWSTCSKPCGAGSQTRILLCTNANLCGNEMQLIQNKVCNLQACKEDVDKHLEKLKQVACGKWELLGPWSQCTKPCGGGIRTIKRICVGGNCIGDEILTEDCNTFKCNDGNLKYDKTFKCENLHGEFELLYKQASSEFKSVPCVVEININNIEVYAINDLNRVRPLKIISFSQLSDVKPSLKFPNCMKLCENSGSNTRLCDNATPTNLYDIWIDRIRKFKEKCSNQVFENIWTSLKNPMQIDPISQIQQMNQNMQQQKRMQDNAKQRTLQLQYQEFRRQSNLLMRKEDMFEQQLLSLEKQRIDKDEKTLAYQIQKEKDFTNRILNDLKVAAQEENSVKMTQNLYQNQMQNSVRALEKQIAERREKLLNSIQAMRTTHQIKQADAMKQLLEAKKKFGLQVAKIASGGNPNQCFSNQSNTSFIQSYCIRNFRDGTLKYECMKKENFCYMCCNKEVGMSSPLNTSCCQKHCNAISVSSECGGFDSEYNLTEIKYEYGGN